MKKVRAIYGVDFSGAQDAGNKIWIGKGVQHGRGLLIKECFRARELPNSGKVLDDCLPALVNLVRSETNATFGFDFPFGLPTPLVNEDTWKEFVLGFHSRYKSPEEFREACRRKAPGSELKRRTDTEARTPFSPYNLRLFKQTYYGISKVLFPLVRDDSACILPFQRRVLGKPWLLEVCPASTLKHLMENQVPSYKGPEEDKRKNRRQILEIVMKEGVAFVKGASLKNKIIDNTGGDALDSIIACLTVFKTLHQRRLAFPLSPVHMIDGQVYWRV
jgi:hypothetical protein